MANYDDFLDNKYLAVVAIDFGTTFSGYAYSYRHDCHKIFTSTSGGRFSKDRFPTTVLLNPDKTFHSIGFEAENKYSRLAENEEHRNWYYFRKFKMLLYIRDKLTRDINIRDSEGRPMSAMLIFSMVIQHISYCARASVGDAIAKIANHHIRWIITVPAMWSDAAKQLMREAAVKAGLEDTHLQLILEPEAASLFCKEESFLVKIGVDQGVGTFKMTEGHKYILADLGGGTADICVHQIVEEENLREICRATGGAVGGLCVDIAFEQLFIKLIGADSWMQFKRDDMDDYLTLMRTFEIKKSTFSTTTKEDEIFTLPIGLIDVVEETLGKTFNKVISESDFINSMSVRRKNKLNISATLMEEFFKPTVMGIVALLNEILSETEFENIQTLLLVGGFAESPYLRDVIKSEIAGVQVIFPQEGSLAVLKGAVLMGYRPRTITERKARHNYGFSKIVPFQKNIHPQNLRLVYDDQEWCRRIFCKIIERGQVLKYGQIIKYKSRSQPRTPDSKHRALNILFYRSTKSDPIYCTEEDGCSLVGEIEMKSPEEGWPDEISLETCFVVDEAEFSVKVFNETTADEYEAKIDFL